jgi:MraZ protein
MALFVGTFTNRRDAKSRVSLPATFRDAISYLPKPIAQNTIYLFSSPNHPCLEGFDYAFVHALAQGQDGLSGSDDNFAIAFFGQLTECRIDQDGRFTLLKALAENISLGEQVLFTGMGKKFQIWDPKNFERFEKESEKEIKKQGGLSLMAPVPGPWVGGS